METSIATKKCDEGVLIFRFDHLKDASIAYNTTRTLISVGQYRSGWSVQFVDPSEFHGDHSRDREGQVKVAIKYHGEDCDEGVLRKLALSVVQESSDVVAHHINMFDPKQLMLVLEVDLVSISAADLINMKYSQGWKPVIGHEVS